MFLYELMKTAGKGNYFYCDTDSLIINEAGLWKLKIWLNDTELGYLKLVEKTQACTIRGLKDYSIGRKQVLKGVKKNAVKIADGVYDQEVWPSFKGLLRSGKADSYIVKKQRRILQRKYTKGTRNKDGTISPLVLADSRLLLPQLW